MRQATVIVPRDSTASFLMTPWDVSEFSYSWYGRTQDNSRNTIGYFADSSLNSQGNHFAFSALKSLCWKFWTEKTDKAGYRDFLYSSKPIFSEEVITKVVQAAFRWNDQAFLEDADGRHKGKFSLEFFSWARLQLETGDAAFDSVKNGYGAIPPTVVMLIMQFVACRLSVLRALETQCSSLALFPSIPTDFGRHAKLDK